MAMQAHNLWSTVGSRSGTRPNGRHAAARRLHAELLKAASAHARSCTAAGGEVAASDRKVLPPAGARRRTRASGTVAELLVMRDDERGGMSELTASLLRPGPRATTAGAPTSALRAGSHPIRVITTSLLKARASDYVPMCL